jgi:hypothetical protein
MEVGGNISTLGMVGQKIGKKSQETQAQVVTDAMQNAKQLVQGGGSGGAHKIDIKA